MAVVNRLEEISSDALGDLAAYLQPLLLQKPPPVATPVTPYSPPIAATTLPGSPTDGQQATYVDSTSAPTYSWLLQWSAAASVWLFLGGTPKEGTSSVVVPRAGSYLVRIGTQARSYAGGSSNDDITITAGGITLRAAGGSGGGGTEVVLGSLMDEGRMTGLTASQTLTVTTSTGSPLRQYIRVYPIAVT